MRIVSVTTSRNMNVMSLDIFINFVNRYFFDSIRLHFFESILCIFWKVFVCYYLVIACIFLKVFVCYYLQSNRLHFFLKYSFAVTYKVIACIFLKYSFAITF